MTTATNVRAVHMSAEQAEVVEELVGELIRAGDDERAMTLMTVALAYKVAKPTPMRPIGRTTSATGTLALIRGGRDDVG